MKKNIKNSINAWLNKIIWINIDLELKTNVAIKFMYLKLVVVVDVINYSNIYLLESN